MDATQPQDAQRPDEVKRLVAAVLAHAERGGRDAVERICARHPDLADAIRERVDALRRSGLWRPEGDAALPERFGEFRVLRRLGEGGMGVVYLGEQESVPRQVALKVIRPEYVHDARSRERFLREVEAASRLQHPGIVPVFAYGEEREVPYFAMELVHGRTLDQALRGLRGRTPRSLRGADLGPSFGGGWEDACLDVARQVAEALEHAHRHGVLHRDVKPSNVALDESGRARLLDFGLAAVDVPGSVTRSGSQLGSLPYMAPEQILGTAEVDARTDVYALGVTLFELLTLRSPYAGRSAAETLTRVLDGRPPPLRRLHPGVSWETEAACLAAMDPEPAGRYASAADFARDLANVRARRPIAARQPSRLRRVRRWSQRHPGAGLAVVLALLLVIGGPLVFALQERQRRVAVAAERDRVQEEEEASRQLYDFLASAFFRFDPLEAQGEELSAREFLDRTAREAETSLGGQPRIQAALLRDFGDIYLRSGDLDRAAELLEQALAIRRAELPDERRELADCLKSVGWLRHLQGDYGAAEALMREALALRRDLASGDDEDVAVSLNDLAEVVRVRGDYDEARELYLASLELHRRLFGDEHPWTAMVLNNLGHLELVTGRLEEAHERYREVLRIREGVLEETHPHFLMSVQSLTNSALRLGRLEEADEHGARALELARRIYAGDHEDVAYSLSALAGVHAKTGRALEAEDLYRLALAMCRRLYGDEHPQTAYRMDKLGVLLAERGELAEAEELARGSLEILSRTLGDAHESTATGMTYLAEVLLKKGEHVEAEELLRAALAVHRDVFDAEHPSIAAVLERLGELLHDLGRCGEAEELLRELVGLHRRRDDDARTARAETLLGSCLTRGARLAEAETLLRGAHERLLAVRGEDDPWTRDAGARLRELRSAREAAAGAPAGESR